MMGRKRKACRGGCLLPLLIAGNDRGRCGLCGSPFTYDRATSQWVPVHDGAKAK